MSTLMEFCMDTFLLKIISVYKPIAYAILLVSCNFIALPSAGSSFVYIFSNFASSDFEFPNPSAIFSAFKTWANCR